MISAPFPDNEEERQHWLDRLRIVGTVEEQAYDDIALLAAQICDTPIALVSLIDHTRQWFKAHHGLDARETPRAQAFCAHAILSDDVFVVEDSDRDKRFHDNPLATGQPYVKFYAGAPLILRDGIRLGTLCVIDDHARRISSQQQRALEALARQVISQMELRLRVQTLEQLDAAKDEFIATVNHELRTPLTSIIGSLGLLENNVVSQLDSEAAKLVKVANRNADQLLNMVNDILELARLETGRIDLDRESVDLRAVVEQAIELNAPFCQRCGISIGLDPTAAPQPLTAYIDKQRILQVLNNLISNAAKFSHEGDTIEVSLSAAGSNARIAVSDHGAGIAPEQHGKVFEKFVQLSGPGKNKLPGTGLGLTICKKIIELHSGEIDFESIPDQQTTFFFTLPMSA